jgi:hypothetical protein
MTRERVAALRQWLADNGYGDAQAAFGTVFRDRGDPVFRRHVGDLAWGSFVWFTSEPTNILLLLDGGLIEPRRTLDQLVQ